jgi:hypothetical protein
VRDRMGGERAGGVAIVGYMCMSGYFMIKDPKFALVQVRWEGSIARRNGNHHI